MKTFLHLWQYLAEFFLQWEMFQIKVVEKIKTNILCQQPFSGNRVACEIMWKNLVEPELPQTRWRRVSCCISKVTHAPTRTHTHPPTHTHTRARTHTHTHKFLQDVLFFHVKYGFVSEPQYYVIHTSPVLYSFQKQQLGRICDHNKNIINIQVIIWTIQPGYTQDTRLLRHL